MHRFGDEAIPNALVPDDRIDGQRPEEADGSPLRRKVRSNDSSVHFRDESVFGLRLPPTVHIVGISEGGHRVFEPKLLAKRATESALRFAQVVLPIGRTIVAMTHLLWL